MTSPDIRVLLVEDDLRLATLTRTYLESRGLEVVHTPDGASALDLLRGTDVTAVVLDLMLPGIDGYEVCRRLRAFSDVPVLMVTALDAEGDRVLGLEVGADDYICKPFSSPELLARILSRHSRGERNRATIRGRLQHVFHVYVDVHTVSNIASTRRVA